MTTILTNLLNWFWNIRKKIPQKWAPAVCDTESPETNSKNQEHYRNDAEKDFDSYDDVIE